MTGKLRALGLALCTVLLLGAIGAQGVSAHGFTSESNSTVLTATSESNHTISLTGTKTVTMTCTDVSANGIQSGKEIATITLHPTYSGCSSPNVANITVDSSGCNRVFSASTTKSAHYSGEEHATVSFECEKSSGSQHQTILTSANEAGTKDVFSITGTKTVKVECGSASLAGTEIGEVNTITAHPKYSNCSSSEVASINVDTDGCNYVFDSDTTTSAHSSSDEHATTSIECEQASGSHTHSIRITAGGCTIDIGATHPTNTMVNQSLHGVTYASVKETGKDALTLKYTLRTIVATTTGPNCSLLGIPAGTYSGTHDGVAVITGYEDNGIKSGSTTSGVTYEEGAQVGVVVTNPEASSHEFDVPPNTTHEVKVTAGGCTIESGSTHPASTTVNQSLHGVRYTNLPSHASGSKDAVTVNATVSTIVLVTTGANCSLLGIKEGTYSATTKGAFIVTGYEYSSLISGSTTNGFVWSHGTQVDISVD